MSGGGMTASGFVVVDAASGPARYAISRYVDELQGVLPHGFTLDEALAAARSSYSPPEGLFVVLPGQTPAVPLAGGALRFLDDERAEVKRMWVDPDARGRGLATRLLRALEEHAVRHGSTTIVLDTNTALTSAVRLYERSGYVRVPRYNDNRDADVWFQKRLGAAGVTPPPESRS